ncbi:hypothetical protein [Neorhizobium alkalisoli]|uniref:Uncharacterized protein n=1 Tax=Neorhizobium alkalisoli TaxID=528178 RepID=A0A561QGL8_9HYPH|nr:hypothetical protein [Neorhizobium alkalisoli]TWF49505.1 hypothetical protein FHW37_108175 [Neorhizobium alkalisoli]
MVEKMNLREIDYRGVSGRDKAKLKVIESSLRSGLSRTAQRFIERFEPSIIACSQPAAASILEELIRYLSQVKQAEEQYGYGAMLDYSRPVVKSLLSAKKFDGEPAITLDMVKARDRRLANAA